MIGWRFVRRCSSRTGGNRSHASRTLASNSEASVKVAWKMKHRCNFGQHVAVVGGHENLGNWEPKSGLAMTWTDGDDWVGEADLEPGQLDGSLGYWKPGKNADIDLQVSPGSFVVVVESWNEFVRRVEVHQPLVVMQAAPAPTDVEPEAEAALHVPAPDVLASSKIKESLKAVPQKDPLLQHAEKSMMDLKDAIILHENVQQQVKDPTAVEVLQADRILAAANNKAIAMNKALKAVEAFPQLPGPKES